MKTNILLVVALLWMSTAVCAEQASKKEVFWDKLQNKLEKLTPAKKGATTTAVGGVRGAKNEDATDIYWKGKDKTVVMNEEELQKFNLAIDTKLKGDNEQSLKYFEEFLAQYPESPLRVEGLQAAEKIKLELAASKAPVKLEAASQPAALVETVAQPVVAVPPVAQPAIVPEKAPEAVLEGQPAR